MKSDTILDYAVFQLSPKRSRCELFVSSGGRTEKLASGLLKPFVSHLKVAEEQVASAVNSIKLEVNGFNSSETWFNKATIERFVRFVSTPEVLELVNSLDAEMSQLEAARRIYNQGSGGEGGLTEAADATKKELLRAIDVRLDAVKKDLTTACSRAASAGFTPGTISELQLFAHQFGGTRLHDACNKFRLLCERRLDLVGPFKVGTEDQAVRSSYGSDMSIDEDHNEEFTRGSSRLQHSTNNQQQISVEADPKEQQDEMEKAKASWQSKKSLSAPLRRSEDPIINRDESKDNDGLPEAEKGEDKSPQIQASQSSHPTRRLSVQDRINMFENKQKETSGGKPAIVKPVELRRLSSDVSPAPAAVEKSVLRRWSGASDMSIDLSNEKKEIESPLPTPSSSSVSQSKAEESKNITGMVILDQSKNKIASGGEYSGTEEGIAHSGEISNNTMRRVFGPDKTFHSFNSEDTSTIERGEACRIQFKSSSARFDDNSSKDQVASQTTLGSLCAGGEERYVSTNQGNSECSISTESKITEFKDQPFSQAHQVRPLLKMEGKVLLPSESYQHSDGEFENTVEDDYEGGPLVSEFKASTKRSTGYTQLEDGSGFTSNQRFKKIESDSLPPESHSRFLGEAEDTVKGIVSSDKQPVNFSKKAFHKRVSSSEQLKMPSGRGDEITFHSGNTKSNKMTLDNEEVHASVQKPSAEQLQRVRQSKGNQELNDELKMKANELEKLFAEHKLRAPGEQPTSARRSKPAQKDQSSNSLYGKATVHSSPVQLPDENITSGSSRNLGSMSIFSTPTKFSEGQDSALKQNSPGLDLSEDSKGKFYERYMQKRDTKLREEWSTKRVEKETKMKAMQDILDQNRAEMTKFSGYVDKQDPTFSARRRAERIRAFGTRSSVKGEQSQVDLEQNEDEEYLSEFAEDKPFSFDRSLADASIGDGASRSIPGRKLQPGRNLSSTVARASIAKVPNKPQNSTSLKRRLPSVNPLTQSVPNFSELRKENARPSPGATKTTRSQTKSSTRKSINEDTIPGKEEKPRRPHSTRKNLAGPAEFDSSLLNSGGAVLAPLKFDSDHLIPDKIPKDMVEPKPFLRKGTGIGAGVGVAKMKSLKITTESVENEEELDFNINNNNAFDQEASTDMDHVEKDEEDEEEGSDSMVIEDDPDELDNNNAKPRLSQDTTSKSVNSGSESGDDVKRTHVTDMPTALKSSSHLFSSMQNSPGESPLSWNAHTQHAFSYQHETSDVDAYADSPIGSPASWNSRSLSQAEADAARMRKKWGNAQKPLILGNSSNNHSRKDMTKGFKRLLKFGRKSRGTDSLADWISATTSEGDDDTEDGRDPANRSSDDLRKSRMGFSHGHPSDDSLNEGELYHEQGNSSIPVPSGNFKMRGEEHLSGSSIKASSRSFFSLSSFRSKGSSDSKHR